MKASEKILLEQSHLATDDLPKTFSENCDRVWRAFFLGRQFEEIKQAIDHIDSPQVPTLPDERKP